MRGTARVLIWVVILAACAGIGAFLASRSNPFPPEVRVESPTQAPTPTPGEPTPWRLTMTSRTRHAYRVGGSCTSDWQVRARIFVSDGGRVLGTGRAKLERGAGCDFETAQVQARTVALRLSGSRAEGRLRLRFQVAEVSPPGAQDLGGFVETVPAMRFSIRERDGASASGRTQVVDGDGENHSATSSLRLDA